MQCNRNLVQLIYNRQILLLSGQTCFETMPWANRQKDSKVQESLSPLLTSLYRHFSVTYSLCSGRVRLYFIGKTSIIKHFSKMDNRYMYIISPNSDKIDPYMTEKQVILHFSTKTNISKFQFDQDRGPARQPVTYEHSHILSVFTG